MTNIIVSLSLDELKKYIDVKSRFHNKEVYYKCLYRITDGFNGDSYEYAKNYIDCLISFGKSTNKDILVLQEILDKGLDNNYDYYPSINYMETADLDDISVVLDECKCLKMKDKKKCYEILKPIYEKYRDFSFDVDVLDVLDNYESIGYLTEETRLSDLASLNELYEKEIEPYYRLIINSNNSRNKNDFIKTSGIDRNQKCEHFPKIKDFDEEKALKLCRLLKGKFFSDDVEDNVFLYMFGYKGDVTAETIHKIYWIVKNKKTKQPSKISLLDFLRQLGYNIEEIRQNINSVFDVGGNKKFGAQNYTEFRKGQNSEYHDELSKIITKSKK